jgi:hypothetical protein
MLLGLCSTILRPVTLQPLRTQDAKPGQNPVLMWPSAPRASHSGEHNEQARGHDGDSHHRPVNNTRTLDCAQDPLGSPPRLKRKPTIEGPPFAADVLRAYGFTRRARFRRSRGMVRGARRSIHRGIPRAPGAGVCHETIARTGRALGLRCQSVRSHEATAPAARVDAVSEGMISRYRPPVRARF